MRMREAIRQAKKAGAEFGKKMAAPFPTETEMPYLSEILMALTNGDPENLLSGIREPELSGEFAGDPTPLSLTKEIFGNVAISLDVMDALREAWETAARKEFWKAFETNLKAAAAAEARRCYGCDGQLTNAEAVRVADEFDAMKPEQVNEVTDRLWLIDCRGPKEYFLADGRVVVCESCLHGKERKTS